jgi:hypothetical protein
MWVVIGKVWISYSERLRLTVVVMLVVVIVVDAILKECATRLWVIENGRVDRGEIARWLLSK